MDSPAGLTAKKFVDEMSSLSDGKMTVQFFPGGLLGDTTFMLEQISQGTLDFHVGYVSTSLDPRLDVLNVPGIAWDWEHAVAILQDPKYLSIFDGIASKVGWKVLGTVPCCFNKVVSTKKFVPEPSDVSQLGLKTRSMAMQSDVMTVDALGFNAVPMAFSEVATAMATGAVDAAAGPAMYDLGTFKGIGKYRLRLFLPSRVAAPGDVNQSLEFAKS